MLSRFFQSSSGKSTKILFIVIITLAVPSLSDLHAFEAGNDFLAHNFASRLMRRYELMGNNEHITYPVRVFNMEITDEQANKILENFSVVVSQITEAMYNHHDFKVKSVTFTLEANGSGWSTSGDPMPLNVQLDVWWGMGYANNWLGVTKEWALNPNSTDGGLYHEFGHHFLLGHLDLNDGYFPRSTMDTPDGDVPIEYLKWGGDDLAGAIHMWRYTCNMSAPKCPEFYTLQTVGVTGDSFPDAKPYPESLWRCDPDKVDRHGLRIKNTADGRCMAGSDGNDETNVSISSCDSKDDKQLWDFLADEDGSFRIKNVANGKCMQVRGSSLSSGAVIEQFSCNASDSSDASQKFYPIADGSGHYSVRSELSARVVEASGDGAIQSTPNGANIQHWTLSSCGNDQVETGEECEQNSDCVDGGTCSGCECANPDDTDTNTETENETDGAVEASGSSGCNCSSVGNRSSFFSSLLSLLH
ncbi:MAG: RICIN domain-containing protein [Myxococcota bacterium]|jgi:hypothetical protein|nr:RICIN domain-containing protein [Myxococcota bacterium]